MNSYPKALTMSSRLEKMKNECVLGMLCIFSIANNYTSFAAAGCVVNRVCMYANVQDEKVCKVWGSWTYGLHYPLLDPMMSGTCVSESRLKNSLANKYTFHILMIPQNA